MERFIDIYLTTKFYFGQGNQHLSLIIDIAKNMMIGVMFLRVLNIDKRFTSRRFYWTLVGILGVMYVLGVIFAGYLAVELDILSKENTLNQKYNAELQSILSSIHKS